MADKSPRQHQSKRSGKTLKEKRSQKKAKQATKRAASLPSDELRRRSWYPKTICSTCSG
jgi:hypothetical protein